MQLSRSRFGGDQRMIGEPAPILDIGLNRCADFAEQLLRDRAAESLQSIDPNFRSARPQRQQFGGEALIDAISDGKLRCREPPPRIDKRPEFIFPTQRCSAGGGQGGKPASRRAPRPQFDAQRS
jgi:hypothetical protein